jgi:hypothetical protein
MEDRLPVQSTRLNHGTGSYPCPPHGWHFEMRFTDNHNPLKTPYFFRASKAYWEQVGVNRHLGPSKGEIIHWYSFMRRIKGRPKRLSIVFIKKVF